MWCQVREDEWKGKSDKYEQRQERTTKGRENIEGEAERKKGDRYVPNLTMPERRTAEEGDLTEEWLQVMLEAQETATNPWIVGKLGDLLWRNKKRLASTEQKRITDCARRAVKAWLSVDAVADAGLDLTTAWPRAASVAEEAGPETLRSEIKARMKNVLEELAAEKPGKEGQVLAGQAATIALQRCRTDQRERNEIARILARLADKYDRDGDHNWTQGTRKDARRWAQRGGDNNFADEQGWLWGLEEIRWVEDTHGGENETPWALSMYYGEAITAMESYAKKKGNEHNLEELEAVRVKQQGYALRSGEGLKEFTTGPIDISEYVEKAEAETKGKSFNEAMQRLALAPRVPQDKVWFERKAAQAYAGTLSALATHVFVDQNGQRIRPEKDREGTLSAPAMEQFDIHAHWAVDTQIVPRVRVITEEHRGEGKEWFLDLSRKSRWVPESHQESWAEGLMAGLAWDWKGSMHLLLPRVEACLRHVAWEAGILRLKKHTGTTDEAWGMRDTLESERSKKLVSESLRTELNATIHAPSGWNLRNRHCHGLMGDMNYNHHASVYTWWLLLHITLCAAIRQDLPLRTFAEFGGKDGEGVTSKREVVQPPSSPAAGATNPSAD